jgi:hypothetical protein
VFGNKDETRLCTCAQKKEPCFTIWTLPDLTKLAVCTSGLGLNGIQSTIGVINSQMLALTQADTRLILVWDLPDEGSGDSEEKKPKAARKACTKGTGAGSKEGDAPPAKQRRRR